MILPYWDNRNFLHIFHEFKINIKTFELQLEAIAIVKHRCEPLPHTLIYFLPFSAVIDCVLRQTIAMKGKHLMIHFASTKKTKTKRE